MQEDRRQMCINEIVKLTQDFTEDERNQIIEYIKVIKVQAARPCPCSAL